MPAPDGTELPPDQLFLESGPLINEVVRFACRHFRLSREDAQDFRQEFLLKLMQEDYRVFRCWKRQSALRSYLASVVLHFGADYMDRLMGKFHSSAKAIELGEEAICLERLLVRDGLSYDHAKEVLRSRHGVTLSDAELDWLRAQLPPRTRRQFQDFEVLEKYPDPGSNPEAGSFAKYVRESRRILYPILACAMKEMGAREQMFLRLRFCEGLTIAKIARAWNEKQKPLYREMERIIGGLRKKMEEAGVNWTAVDGLLFQFGGNPEDDGLPEDASLWQE